MGSDAEKYIGEGVIYIGVRRVGKVLSNLRFAGVGECVEGWIAVVARARFFG